MTPAKQLIVVSAHVPAAMVDAVLDALSDNPFTPTAWEDVEQGTCSVNIFLEQAEEAPAVAQTLQRTGTAFGLKLEPLITTIAPENWTDSWKRFFHIEHVSPRVVIRPVWEPYTASASEVVIDIEPGMSFGTGRHGTTRGSLELIDCIATEYPGRSLLDMGCGSGILAIGAVKLGFQPVRGFDNDLSVIEIAQENMRHNGVAIHFYHGELAQCTDQAEVVVANICTPVLIQYAGVIARCVLPVPGHALVISGILEEKYADVVAAFTRHGFIEQASRTIEGWRSGWLRRG